LNNFWQIETKYLNTSLNNVKRKLGGICSHLSFTKTKIKDEKGVWKNIDAVKAVLYNGKGGKDTITIKAKDGFNKIDFEALYKMLKEETYVG
jgi:hypothetical protein